MYHTSLTLVWETFLYHIVLECYLSIFSCLICGVFIVLNTSYNQACVVARLKMGKLTSSSSWAVSISVAGQGGASHVITRAWDQVCIQDPDHAMQTCHPGAHLQALPRPRNTDMPSRHTPPGTHLQVLTSRHSPPGTPSATKPARCHKPILLQHVQ